MWTCIEDLHSETGVPSAKLEHVLDAKQFPFVVSVALDTLEVAPSVLRFYGNHVQLLQKRERQFVMEGWTQFNLKQQYGVTVTIELTCIEGALTQVISVEVTSLFSLFFASIR
jgi:ABC-type phosphate transport system permease subunit